LILDHIDGPSDLRGLTQDELTQLADELRSVIIETATRVKGHLGSNLGAVELTIALHRVFDSPDDIILWDTGHQTYVHKLLTGRRDRFDTLRQAGGISGYPSRAESPHDWIENSHASTVLGYAHGLATATALDPAGEQRKIVAVIGDGSMTGGMAFEGLNNLGHSGRDCVIVLNDNGRSYAPTISKLGESLARLRSNPRFRRGKARAADWVAKVPVISAPIEAGVGATKAAIRQMLEPPAFFEMLGVNYLGPFDGHDIAGVEGALKNASAMGGPVVVHVLTQKGRGYAPAENDPIKRMHDLGGAKPGSYTAAFTEALLKVGEERSDVVAITAAMPDSTGLLPFQDRFPDRLFDVGIAEQHAVTAAAGMALGGLKPVVALYSTFLTRAIDQVNLDVGLHRAPVVFCLDRAGITGDDGPSHNGLLDMVLLTKVPGMTVFAPSSYQDLQVMLADAVELDGPAAIRWPKTEARNVPEHEVGVGRRALKLRDGSEVCIIAVGKMVGAALGAADALEADGISTSVWDARCVAPLDDEMLDNATTHPAVVTAEDGLLDGGVGESILRNLLVREAGRSTRTAVLGVPKRYLAQGKADDILAELGLDGAGIAASARELLAP
jgi:1-deoxy-D-xylulose-5-phosphate synthase